MNNSDNELKRLRDKAKYHHDKALNGEIIKLSLEELYTMRNIFSKQIINDFVLMVINGRWQALPWRELNLNSPDIYDIRITTVSTTAIAKRDAKIREFLDALANSLNALLDSSPCLSVEDVVCKIDMENTEPADTRRLLTRYGVRAKYNELQRSMLEGRATSGMPASLNFLKTIKKGQLIYLPQLQGCESFVLTTSLPSKSSREWAVKVQFIIDVKKSQMQDNRPT